MSRAKVLVVDDNEATRNVLSKQLEMLEYEAITAGDGQAAVKLLSRNDIDMVLLDVNMPGMSGIEVLRSMNGHRDETPALILSGLNTVDIVRTTLREGAYDYLVKPWDFEELKLAVSRALAHGRLTRKNKAYQHQLENEVRDRTSELEKALIETKATYRETILALGSALETRDVETQHHALRVAYYCALIAETIGVLDDNDLKNIEWGAYLHDIGKIGVPDSILRKPESLTSREWAVMKTHPEIGRRVIANIPFLKGTIPIVYCHHEHFDGSGYPRGLKGDMIPIEARIFSVADALDAMFSDRPYRKAMPFPKAIDIVGEQSGRQFDPAIAGVITTIHEERWFERSSIFS